MVSARVANRLTTETTRNAHSFISRPANGLDCRRQVNNKHEQTKPCHDRKAAGKKDVIKMQDRRNLIEKYIWTYLDQPFLCCFISFVIFVNFEVALYWIITTYSIKSVETVSFAINNVCHKSDQCWLSTLSFHTRVQSYSKMNFPTWTTIF